MTVLGLQFPLRKLLVVAMLIGIGGCAVLPVYKHPNRELHGEPVDPVGSYNASLSVPWSYNFHSVSESQAADCRRYLVTKTPRPGAKPNPCEGIDRDENFVALALSGGGSRSAALSAAIMWELDRLGILKHVDVISAASGGAQAAALYSLTRDVAGDGHADDIGDHYVFDRSNAKQFVGKFERNLSLNWAVSLLMPWHLSAYMFTYFDRTDVMADTLADNYYPRGSWYDINWGMRFRDINPKRPNLLINAVDMTLHLGEENVPKGIAGKCFPIVYETIRDVLGSDIHEFPIAQAAMASGAYPALFQYVSLRNFRRETAGGRETYLHLADGGIRDHLALVPINAMLRRFAEGRSLEGIRYEEIVQSCDFSRGALNPTVLGRRVLTNKSGGEPQPNRALLPKKILVIAIDGGKPPRGVEETDADPRSSLLDFMIPVTNIIDTVDTTLDDQRILRAVELIELRKNLTGKKRQERDIRDCVVEEAQTTGQLAKCLTRVRRKIKEGNKGILGPECCPVIGFGVHNFTKFASHDFGAINDRDLDSDKTWGVDQVTLECLQDNDYGRGRKDSLYSRLRKMPIGLSLSSDQMSLIVRAARALVDEMVADFCDRATERLAGLEGISCIPSPIPREVMCKN